MSTALLLLGLACISSAVSAELTPVVLINAGSTSSYEDGQGFVWEADPNTQGVRSNNDGTPIENTSDDDLYTSFRFVLEDDGPLYYNIPLDRGTYTVQLHFAELRKTQAGTRIFDIVIEDTTVFDSYDCFEQATAAETADIREFRDVSVRDGTLNLEFQPEIGHSMVAAIGVFRDSRPPEDPPTPSPTVNPLDYQPLVIDVEAYPPGKAQGFIGIPEGSPWCNGRAVYWWSGHDNRPEEPHCQQRDGSWAKSSTAILDRQDVLNIEDGPEYIDRHDCVVMDANRDGIDDIICVVGANRGTGVGFNEVYYTQRDGTIQRQMQDLGLYAHNTMRTRLAQTLTAADDGSPMIMITTTGGPREDGRTNAHHMYKLNDQNYFDEVTGPFNQEFTASCNEIVDLNNDGIDDLIICDEEGPAQAFIQRANGRWSQLASWEALDPYYMQMWNGARVADVTGDGVNDLLVAGPYKAWHNWNPDPYFRVYPGNPSLATLFDFENPVIDDTMPHHTMDVEVIDLNGDGLLDMYVVTWNLTLNNGGGYCDMPNSFRDWWPEEEGHDFPPDWFAPPPDEAPDYLYLSIDGDSWDRVEMEHAVPGCGSRVQKWGQYSLAVAHGHLSRPGNNVILEWPAPPSATPIKTFIQERPVVNVLCNVACLVFCPRICR